MTAFLRELAPVWQPHSGQLAFLQADARIKVLSCGRRWGKTDACAAEVVGSLMGGEPTRHLLLAPTLAQAQILFQRVLDLLAGLIEHRPRREPSLSAKVRRTPFPRARVGIHSISARSGHVGRSLRGDGATHIVVDEAAFVPEELITEVAMPMLATTDGRLTLISTPRGRNHFWRFFQMGRDRRHGVWSRTAPSSESPFVSGGYLELQRELISERAFRTEYLGEFLESEGRVFRTDAIDAALVSQLGPAVAERYWIGIDWALSVDATAVVAMAGTRRDARLVAAHRFQADSWSDTVCRVREILKQFPHAEAFADATGVGAPVLEQLQRELPSARLHGATFTSPFKSSLIGNLVWMFENGAIQMEPHPDLIRELQHFEAVPSGTGTVRLGAASGFHDDLVIAMALACYRMPAGPPAPVRLGETRRFSTRPSQGGNP